MTPKELLNHPFTLLALIEANPCYPEFNRLMGHLGLPTYDMEDICEPGCTHLCPESASGYHAHYDHSITLTDVIKACGDRKTIACKNMSFVLFYIMLERDWEDGKYVEMDIPLPAKSRLVAKDILAAYEEAQA